MTIHKLFEQQVLLTPDHTAVICEGKSLTYRELNEKANRLGNAIRGYYHTIYREDILPDTPVGVCINRGVDMIVAILGILKAGCAYMPVDPSYPADRLRFMMDDALAPLVVTEMALLEKLLFLNQADYGIISLDGGWDVISKYSDKNPEQINGPDNLAYIIYTSGSTGRPKGVMIEHKSAVNFICNEKNLRHIAPGDRVLQFASINFDASVTEIYPALLSGATLHIAGNDIRKDPEALYHYVSEQSINDMFLPPPVLHAMPKKDLPSLRSIVVGGDVCNRETLNFWSKGRKIINEYGPTECTVVSNESIYSDGILHNEIGRPIANMKAYILDSHLNPVPEGTEGELYIGGIGVGRGYLNRQSLTDERFIKNPFVTGEEIAKGRNLRIYRTGDLVKWIKGGSIEFIGRADSQVKIRGFRVEPGEIETVLSSHGEIKDCAVSTYTEGTEKRLIACYVPVPGTCPSIKNLRTHLEELLPDYMIPSVFMEMETLPLSPGGKIDRKSLPAPTQDIILAQREKSSEYTGPESQDEKDICDIVTKILNMEKISIADDLFDLGVHSLMAASIASEIRKKFSKKIELKDIFEHRTIQYLAEFISKKTGSEHIISIPKLTHRKNIPLSFQQEQIWFLSKLVPNNRAYNFQFAIRFKGALDKDILTKSLNEIIRRHEILRTTFCEGIKGPVQIVHAPWKAVIPEIDLRSFPCDKREEEANKLIEEELAQPFDFGRLPLVKWRIYRMEDDDCIFFHMEHHFLHDGWEVAIFLKELMALYSSFKEGHISPLEELPVQYADYAFWQRNYLSGDRLEEKLGYWVNKIKDYPQVLNLPADHPRPPVQTFNGAVIKLEMNRKLYHSLREFSKTNKVTLFNTMYSAFAVLMSKYSRQTQFLIGTGFANRTFKETENLMGMFVNTVLLYSDLTDNPSFYELLRTTKEAMVYDSMHYDIPFMHIVERLKAGNVQGRNPLFQVLFAFHDSAVPLLNFAGIHGHIIEKHNATAKTDINVICIPKAEQHVSVKDANLEEEDITILWEYNSDLFDRETMENMFYHYLTLLEQVITFPEKNVMNIDILTAKEREKILYDFNNNYIDYDRNKTVNELFEEQVRIRQNKTAIVHNERKLSYRELNKEANKLAWKIRDLYKNSLSQELLPGTPVGICVERSIEMMTGILAILKAGGAYVPLPPGYPENRQRFIMDDSDMKIILTQSKLERELPVLREEGRIIISLDDRIDGNVSDVPQYHSAKDTAYIIYTSGSTGNPKGVAIAHRAINNFVVSIKKDIITDSQPLHHKPVLILLNHLKHFRVRSGLPSAPSLLHRREFVFPPAF
ncbi:MAG: amino acid adenylation domain-containing protein [Candidatus Eremiobacterota bacterium]